MENILSIFGAPLTGFGLGMALAAAAALGFAGAWCAWRRIGYSAWIRLCVLALPLMFLFSRVLYVIGNILFYMNTVADASVMLNFWDGGASVLGALLGLLLAAVLCERWQRLPAGKLLDAVGFGILPGVIVERLFEADTELGMGQPIDGGWMAEHPFFAVDDGWGYIVHAVFHYEAVVAAVLFAVVLCWLILRRNHTRTNGDVLLVVIALFGASQALLESLRNDGHMLIGFVRVNQVVSIVLPVAALTVYTIRAHRGMRGFDKRLFFNWLLAAAGIAVATVQEFAVDSSDNALLDYGIMGAALALVVLAGLLTRRYAQRRTAQAA